MQQLQDRLKTIRLSVVQDVRVSYIEL